MSTDDPDIGVALYDRHTQVKAAVKALQRAGFDMKKISTIGRDYRSEQHVIGFLLGPLAAMLFGGLEGAVVVGGVSAMAGALRSIGIPNDCVLRYDGALRANKFLLIVHGDDQEIGSAQEVLKSSGLSSFEHHPAPSEEDTTAPALCATGDVVRGLTRVIVAPAKSEFGDGIP